MKPQNYLCKVSIVKERSSQTGETPDYAKLLRVEKYNIVSPWKCVEIRDFTSLTGTLIYHVCCLILTRFAPPHYTRLLIDEGNEWSKRTLSDENHHRYASSIGKFNSFSASLVQNEVEPCGQQQRHSRSLKVCVCVNHVGGMGGSM